MTGSTKNHEQKMDLHRAGELFHIQTVFDFEMLSLKVKGLGMCLRRSLLLTKTNTLFSFQVLCNFCLSS